jgi:hypothetical protein
VSRARPLRPRRTAHRGAAVVSGYHLRARTETGESLEARVLRLFEPGADVRMLERDVILVFREPRTLAERAWLGAPLVSERGVLTSAPLTEREHRALAGSGDLRLIDAGHVHAHRRAELPVLDPSTLLDLSLFTVVDTRPLGAPQKLRERVVASDAAKLYEARTGRSAEDTKRQDEIVSAIQALDAGRAARANAPSPVTATLASWWSSLRSLFGSVQRAGGGAPARGGGNTSGSELSRPRRAGFFERLWQALQHSLAQNRLFSLLGRQQAAYLRDLFERLERHDDLEVLKRAIPLNGNADGNTRIALSTPSLRTSFDISLRAPGGGGSMLFGGDLYQHLKQAYERVFRRLDAAGKHEEAAFFLAEILNDPARAVSYLEEHGRLALAAELAEARALAPGLVVRQWFLAGDRKRAIAIAVRERAFDDAIARLERSGKKDEAAALRLLHAEHLAAAGRLVLAARVACPVSAGRALALRFLELAREGGDASGLALELGLDPVKFEPIHAALEPVLQDSGPLAERLRADLAQDFVRLGGEAGRPLARGLARSMIADAAERGDAALGSLATKLAHYVGDVFEADFPKIVSFEKRHPSGTVPLRFAATDAGTRPLFDAAVCGSRLLTALGESGAVLLDRNGKRVAEFDVPAERLVIAEDGLRALAVARRGDVMRVSRLDLARRRSEHLGDLALSAFARRFDGQTWLVAEGNAWGTPALLELDVVDAEPNVMRRVPLPLQAVEIVVSERHVSVVGAEPFTMLERLCYERPSLTLRTREGPIEVPPRSVSLSALAASSGSASLVYDLFLDMDSGSWSRPCLRLGATEIPLPNDWSGPAANEKATPAELVLTEEHHFALSTVQRECPRVLLGEIGLGVTLDLVLTGSASASVRVDAGVAVVCDSSGRLLVLDIRARRVVQYERL